MGRDKTKSTAFIVMFIIAAASLQYVLVSYASVDSSGQAGECTLPLFDSPDFATNQSSSLDLRERVWISVRVVDLREASWWVAHDNDEPDAVSPVIHCTLLHADLLEKIPKVAAAVEGADGCKDGVEVCELPSGVSFGGEQ